MHLPIDPPTDLPTWHIHLRHAHDVLLLTTHHLHTPGTLNELGCMLQSPQLPSARAVTPGSDLTRTLTLTLSLSLRLSLTLTLTLILTLTPTLALAVTLTLTLTLTRS